MKLSTLLLSLSLAVLSGCSNFHAVQLRADGSSLTVDSFRTLISSEVGDITFTGPDGTAASVKGIKSQSQVDALELLKVAAQLAKP